MEAASSTTWSRPLSRSLGVHLSQRDRAPLGSAGGVYPYITGLVAGAFILASLEKVFNVKEVEPTYRLALLTALAFPAGGAVASAGPSRAPRALLRDLPHPPPQIGHGHVRVRVRLVPDAWFCCSRSGSSTGPIAVRLVNWGQFKAGTFKKILYWALITLGSRDLSPEAVEFDKKAVHAITVDRHPVGLLAARLRGLHLRIGQGESVVEQRADAYRASVLGPSCPGFRWSS